MHLPEAYRSLPRPSSRFKPSHPSNSFIRSFCSLLQTAQAELFLLPMMLHLEYQENFILKFSGRKEVLQTSCAGNNNFLAPEIDNF